MSMWALLLNVLWIACGGAWMAVGWLIATVVMGPQLPQRTAGALAGSSRYQTHALPSPLAAKTQRPSGLIAAAEMDLS